MKADCEALITSPVAGMIEYEPDAVARIVEYCRGNPFYMHLVAGKVFRRCVQERRTFVGTSDVEQVRRGLVRELGPTNFAHFWEDVPVLDPNEQAAVGGTELPLSGLRVRVGLGRIRVARRPDRRAVPDEPRAEGPTTPQELQE